jgi:AcrR family transcriptional regulator
MPSQHRQAYANNVKTMPKATDLKTRIVRQADKLFMQNGFAATSIKQIAQAAGCTTAALYYYFEGGKGQILNEVVQSYAADITAKIQIAEATSLPDLLERFGQAAREMSSIGRRINWLLLDMDNLGDEEKTFVQAQPLQVHEMLKVQLTRFIEDETEASNLAWVVFSAYMGYSHLFRSLDLQQTESLTWDQFSETLTGAIGRGAR